MTSFCTPPLFLSPTNDWSTNHTNDKLWGSEFVFCNVSNTRWLMQIQFSKILEVSESKSPWQTCQNNPNTCGSSLSIHVYLHHYHCLVNCLCYCPTNRTHTSIKAHEIKRPIAIYFPQHIRLDDEINTLDQTEWRQPQYQYGCKSFICYRPTPHNEMVN